MNIRAKLVGLRKKAGYTQKKFGERLGGYSKNHISNLETGKANPSYEFMEDLESFCEREKIIVDDIWGIFRKEK